MITRFLGPYMYFNIEVNCLLLLAMSMSNTKLKFYYYLILFCEENQGFCHFLWSVNSSFVIAGLYF